MPDKSIQSTIKRTNLGIMPYNRQISCTQRCPANNSNKSTNCRNRLTNFQKCWPSHQRKRDHETTTTTNRCLFLCDVCKVVHSKIVWHGFFTNLRHTHFCHWIIRQAYIHHSFDRYIHLFKYYTTQILRKVQIAKPIHRQNLHYHYMYICHHLEHLATFMT